MNRPPSRTYHHTQTGPWSLVLLAFGLFMFATAWTTRHETLALLIFPPAGVLTLVLAASFHDLTVADVGEHLSIRFGPMPLFQKTIRYDEITGVEVGRTILLDGWGVHLSVRGGWVWNIWGRDCVVIRRRRRVLRLGSDEAENLAGFLKGRIAEAETSVPSPE